MAQRKAFLLRIDPALWAELEAWAADELRSVNGQVEYLLREAIQMRKGQKGRTPLADSPPAAPNPAANMDSAAAQFSGEPL